MASVIAIGVTFLIFLLTLGFIWLISNYILESLLRALPVPEDSAWREIFDANVDTVKTIMLFVPGVLFLFASIKMLVNATRRGEN